MMIGWLVGDDDWLVGDDDVEKIDAVGWLCSHSVIYIGTKILDSLHLPSRSSSIHAQQVHTNKVEAKESDRIYVGGWRAEKFVREGQKFYEAPPPFYIFSYWKLKCLKIPWNEEKLWFSALFRKMCCNKSQPPMTGLEKNCSPLLSLNS